MFDYNTYGADLNLFYPFKDERFSIEARIGYVGILSLIHISWEVPMHIQEKQNLLFPLLSAYTLCSCLFP